MLHRTLITAIYPNPFQAQVEVSLATDQEGPVRITVTDLTGRRMHDLTLIVPAGVSSVNYNGSHLQPGVYVLTVSSGSRVSSTRLLKVGL